MHEQVRISPNGRGEVRIEREVEAVVLVLMDFRGVNAHVLGALEAGEELAHGYVKSRGVARVSECLKTHAEGLGVGQVDGLKAYFVEEDFQFVFLLLL